MELKHVKSFIAVAEELSFTKAAQRLHIAQPPLSRHIKLLEEDVGTLLIKRNYRSIELTKAGHFFYQHALDLLERAESTKYMTRRLGNATQEFSIAVVGSVLYGYLPEIIYRLRLAYPDYRVHMRQMGTTEQIQALKEGKIDVGFGRVATDDPNARCLELREEKMIVALPVNHPLAQPGKKIDLYDIRDENIIISCVTGKITYANIVSAFFERKGLPTPPIREESDLQFALGMVAAGEGISIVPESFSKIHLNVSYHEFSDDKISSSIHMHFRKNDQSEIVRDLLDIIRGIYDAEHISAMYLQDK